MIAVASRSYGTTDYDNDGSDLSAQDVIVSMNGQVVQPDIDVALVVLGINHSIAKRRMPLRKDISGRDGMRDMMLRFPQALPFDSFQEAQS